MFQMTEEQAKYATAVLTRLYAREMGLEITDIKIIRVPEDAKEAIA